MITQIVIEPTGPVWPAVAAENLGELARMNFDDLPRWMMRQAYSELYAELQDVTGGRTWVNRHGWRHLSQLNPA